jgi:hypothetical protein
MRELAMSHIAMSGLAMSGLAMSDLAARDLAPCAPRIIVRVAETHLRTPCSAQTMYRDYGFRRVNRGDSAPIRGAIALRRSADQALLTMSA